MSYRHSVSAEGLEKACLQRWSDFLAGKLAVGGAGTPCSSRRNVHLPQQA